MKNILLSYARVFFTNSKSYLTHTHTHYYYYYTKQISFVRRLQPIDLGDDYTDSMMNELHCRLFFKLCLDDA